MAGLYIHIPFCLSKCAYCGFYSQPSLKRKSEFLEALKQEIVSRRDYLHDEPVETVYFGGGTPSILSIEELRAVFDTLHDNFEIDQEAEITLEANPDTLSKEYLNGLRSLGVNRLSIGIQSFFDNDLKYLSRRHQSEHALQSVNWAKEVGFSNISLDLIYGLPTSNEEQWNRNLDLFFELNVPHLSAYALTLEPNSILTKQIEQGKVSPVNEDDAVRDYEILCRRAAENGFLHYEISNFCRPGMHSRHNSSYWNGTPYIGLGAAAHSYDIRSRSWNVADIRQYIEGMERGERIFEEELLDDDTRYNDIVTVALRTKEGIQLNALSDKYRNYCIKNARRYLDDGLLELSTAEGAESPTLHLSRRGLFVSDMVMSDLMMV